MAGIYQGYIFKRNSSKAHRINPQMAEYSVTLSYLEFMLELPWNTISKDNFNLTRVEKVINKDHFGLDDVKSASLSTWLFKTKR